MLVMQTHGHLLYAIAVLLKLCCVYFAISQHVTLSISPHFCVYIAFDFYVLHIEGNAFRLYHSGKGRRDDRLGT